MVDLHSMKLIELKELAKEKNIKLPKAVKKNELIEILEKDNEHSFLLDYYKNNYPLFLDGTEINKYNDENNLGEYYNNIVKKEMSKYV